MSQDNTFYVRLLLGAMLFLLAVAAGVLYLLSMDSALAFPEHAHLQVPIFIAVLVGYVPVLLGFKAVYDFLRLVDQGEAFSDQAVRLFRRTRILLLITGGYLLVGFIGVWMALGQGHLSMVIALFAGEVIIVFLLTLVTLLEGLFAKASEFRHENELTI